MNIRTIMGPLIILLGIFLLLKRGESFGAGDLIGYFWPSLFVIPLGLLFHWLYFQMTDRRGVGVLIPGGILLTVGAVCQISMLFSNWSVTWPGFILAAAVGLFEFYWFGGRNKWLLIPINILTVLSILFFAVFSLGALFNSMILGQPILAILLILVGVWFVFGRTEHKQG
jgi:hypothetical protein